MATPLKSLSAVFASKVLSPLSPLSLKSPVKLLVPNKENIRLPTRHTVDERRGLNHVAKKLEFSKISPNSKKSYQPVRIQITEYKTTNDLRKEDLIINTPNKKSIIKTGLGESKCLNILGTGRFGTVIRGIHKGRNVAVKVVKTTNSAREKNSFNLHHPNIVKTIDVIEQKGENFSLIVMEYFPNSRQLQSLVEDVNVCLKNKIISFAKQICEGVKFCHTNKVLHLDIKPQNILVCEDVCKLCDFGNSVRLSDIQAFKHQGTVPYTAPELLQGKCPNEQCDIYSLGILYWQLRSRKNPYYEIDNIETVIYKVVKCNERPEIKSPNDEYSKLYQECWSADARCRPCTENVIQRLSFMCSRF